MKLKSYLIPNLIFTLFVPTAGRAQTRVPREKYWTAGYNFAFLGGSTSHLLSADNNNYFHRTVGFLSDGDGRNHTSYAANTSLGLNAGFMWKDKRRNRYTEIKGGFQQNKASYVFDHPYLKKLPPQDNDADDNDSIPITWTESDKYLHYYVSLQRMWYKTDDSFLGGDSYWFVKGSLGQTMMHRNNQHLIRMDNIEDTRNNGDGVVSKTVFLTPGTWMIGAEIGTRGFTDSKRRSLDVGIACYFPLAPTYTQEYEFFIKNKSAGKSQVCFDGASILLNISYTFNDKMKEKPVDTSEVNTPAVATHHHRLNGRKFEIQKTIKTSTDQMTAQLWDKGIVDGDRVSVYLNGELILEDFTVSKKKKDIVLHLKPGPNYLVMHALNLGRISPNTTAITINDGIRKKSIVLNSNKTKSGALEIDYEP